MKSGGEPLKVVHILNVLQPSGAEVMLCNSADLWLGYEKYIIASSSEVGPFASKLEAAGYHIIHIYDEAILKKYIKTYKYLHTRKFDVVHIHREGESYLYAFFARIAYGKTHIVKTVHNVFRFSGKLHIIRILTRWAERILGVKYVSIGGNVYQNELQHLKNKSSIVNNWCDEKRFTFVDDKVQMEARKQLGISEEIFTIISVGNCNKAKNHQMLFEVLRLFKKECEEWKYYHIGEGELTEEEKDICKKYELDDNVLFLGQTVPDQYMKAGNLFVMPSLNEGVSIAAIEAMRTGIAVLFADSPGLRDFKKFSNEESTVYFSKLDIEDFLEKIRKLYKKFRMNELKHSSRQSERISESYNRRESVKKYMEIYKGNKI